MSPDSEMKAKQLHLTYVTICFPFPLTALTLFRSQIWNCACGLYTGETLDQYNNGQLLWSELTNHQFHQICSNAMATLLSRNPSNGVMIVICDTLLVPVGKFSFHLAPSREVRGQDFITTALRWKWVGDSRVLLMDTSVQWGGNILANTDAWIQVLWVTDGLF